jgi:type IV pilus assembly protein PilY1
MIIAIENTSATTWTPLAESLYEATRYFAQIAPAYANSDYSYNVTNRDPYYFTQPDWMTPAQYVPCCKSFVIIFTDGQPTQDLGVPASLQDYAHAAANHGTSVHCGAAGGCTVNHGSSPHTVSGVSNHGPYASHNDPLFQDHHDNCSGYYGGLNSDPCLSNGSHYLDDVAYWAHTTDIRQATIPGIGAAGKDLAGVQNVTVYSFFAFGTGSNILKDAAMVGAFDDLDGNGKPFKDATCGTASPNPLCKEWDEDSNGEPDTYFESVDAFQMRERLMAAITDILKRSASGTSVSILSTTEKGEGALYQAYFYPSKFEGFENIQWLGYLQGLFLDSMGNLREDTNGNKTLDLSTDMIVKLVFNTATAQTEVQRFADADGDGTADSSTPSEIVPLDQIIPIWEAGKELALRAASDRKIYTWVDQNNDGTVITSEFKSFDNGQATLLRPYLNAATVTESQNIINFIRGEDVTGYRSRSITVDGSLHVWKLGDIIYSTPVTVGRPKEQYDLIYGDSSYQQFMDQYRNRRDVVYVGANDGMLHAFNAGTYDPVTRTFDPGTGHTLGEELWAFVPHSLLPHLKWLTQTDYTHVYYVDLKPKVTDVKIFSPDADHPGGWGTILIGGMRFGGGGINVTDDFGSGTQTRTFKSAYFVLDITNPDNPPVLLWSGTDPNMGFTTSYPAVARVANGTGGTRWVTVMGAGPTTYTGERITASPNLFSDADNMGHLYVFDLADGALLRRFDNTTNNEFLSDVISLDGNLDYGVDTIYVGSAYKSTTWQGKLYRVVTNNDTSPANWNLSTLYAAPGPITAAPSISIDSFLHIWVYFGTGRFLSGSSPTNDKVDTTQQAMYGIKETKGCWLGGTAGCPVTVVLSELLDVSGAKVFTDKSVQGMAETTFDDLLTAARSKEGWILNFPVGGERVLVKPVIIGGIVLFSTFTPTDDVCGFQGEGKLYATYFETGSAYTKSAIGEETTGEVKRSISLGQGMPSMAGLHIGAEEGARGFIQNGTGSISEVDTEPPFKFKSGVMIWQEKQM